MSEQQIQSPQPSLIEQIPATPTGEFAAKYGLLVSQGLETAATSGFNLETAIVASGINETAVEQEKASILQKSVEVAAWLQLDPSFFGQPGKVILLTSIADSLVERQDVALTERDKTLMQDIAFMVAGKDSQTLVDIAAADPYYKGRYLEEAESDISKEEAEFYKRITNHELSRSVETILSRKGEGSFLQKQRELLGITEDNELPFTVRVIDAASDLNVFMAHIQEKPDYPEWSEDMTQEQKDVANRQADVASALYDKNKAETAVLEANLEEYETRFGEEYGEMLEAAVRISGDSKELTLRAPQAMALVKYFGEGSTLPDNPDVKNDIELIAAIARHEYGHTQKQFTIGAHNQIGLLMEERKAEFVSGDKQGYQDIKYLFQDLSMATGADVVTLLADSLKEPDVLSSFAARSAAAVGLRNTLLLFALKPLPYEKNPTHAKQFADLSHLVGEADGSALDIPIKETLGRLGVIGMQERATRWADTLSIDLLKFTLDGFYLSYREAHGLRQSSTFRERAIRERAEAEHILDSIPA